MSMCTIKFISTIHKKNMLLVNEYEFMFSKNNFCKWDKENVYYWICVKKCGATFRKIIKNNEHIQNKSCILMDHSRAPNPIKKEYKIIKNKIKTAASTQNLPGANN